MLISHKKSFQRSAEVKEIKLKEVKCNHRKSRVVGTQGSSLRETEAERNWEKREERAETKRHYEREGGGDRERT